MTACRIRVRGLVQGVGFRPYVWRIARELSLVGWVRNDGAGVEIVARGKAAAVAALLERLPREAPVLARVDAVESHELDTGAWLGAANGDFQILDSAAGQVATTIPPDAAICPDCIADILDPSSRRWRYAFTTCTHCGPRYTVSRGIPYDRANTSLAAFPLCPDCATEYGDPADRRFHAETTACPACGPSLALLDASGQPLTGDPLAGAVEFLRAGHIVAIKGLGGFHLACDARNGEAVAELRRRKQRDAKAFAVMALNPASLVEFARIGPDEEALLRSKAGPIVLCPKGERDLPGVAPHLSRLGVLLPATPLHLLLWHEAAGRPVGMDWLAESHDMLLVMTSANPHGEPLVVGNGEAIERLAGIADAYLVHDRDIVVRCDDSVVKGEGTPIRRARGYTPLPIVVPPWPGEEVDILALGGYLKNAVCVLRGRQAYLSQHVGSLDNAATLGFLDETVAHLLSILEVKPAAVAHDLHPDYPSTRLAQRLAAAWDVSAVPVGHHHAHLAAIAAEHGIGESILGLALDGVGLGPDGGLWGGELLRLDGAVCERLGHLRPLALPGGDRAAREPWRMAVSALHGLGRGEEVPGWLARRHPGQSVGPLVTMLDRGLRSPLTTSLGRLFDAAAGLLGTCSVAAYEGQAAMELESLAIAHGPVEPLSGGYRLGRQDGLLVLDFHPLLAWLADLDDQRQGAAVFHGTVAAGLADWLLAAAKDHPSPVVAVGGGCAQNGLLLAGLRVRLEAAGVRLLEARQVPANDGGLALGQSWVARQLLNAGVVSN